MVHEGKQDGNFAKDKEMHYDINMLCTAQRCRNR